jgi:uncharacterized protein with PQ loop repeat
MFIAIVLGVVAGFISYLPYILATAKSKKENAQEGVAGLAGWFFFAILVSFLILFICIVICIKVARDFALPFTLASVAALFIAVFIFGVILPRKDSRRIK